MAQNVPDDKEIWKNVKKLKNVRSSLYKTKLNSKAGQMKGFDVTSPRHIRAKIFDIIKYLKNEKNQKLKKKKEKENRENGPKRPKMAKRPRFFFRRIILKTKRKNEHC